jgi:hypothetical protein
VRAGLLELRLLIPVRVAEQELPRLGHIRASA